MSCLLRQSQNLKVRLSSRLTRDPVPKSYSTEQCPCVDRPKTSVMACLTGRKGKESKEKKKAAGIVTPEKNN